MNTLKKVFGIVWIALALAVLYFGIDIFGPKLSSGKQDDLVFGIIVFFILIPMVVLGLLTFGWFALKDEYKD